MAMGSSLSEAFGEIETNNIKMRKKNKKKSKTEVINPSHIQESIRNNIEGIDKNFESSSNKIKASDFQDYYALEEQNNYYGGYYPYNPNVANTPPKQPHQYVSPPSPHVNPPPHNQEKNIENIQPQPKLIPQPNSSNNISIPKNEYNEFLNYKNEIIQKQKELSQTEGFTNINDDFNDVLLFGLLGIFFLIFTDYIYKLGKKSY